MCARTRPLGADPNKSTTRLRHTCASSYRLVATRRARCCCPFRQQMHLSLHLCRQSTQIDEIMQKPNNSQIWGGQIKPFLSSCVKKLETPKSIRTSFWTLFIERDRCGRPKAQMHKKWSRVRVRVAIRLFTQQVWIATNMRFSFNMRSQSIRLRSWDSMNHSSWCVSCVK